VDYSVSPLSSLLKGEHAMKDEDLFSHDGPPLTASDHEGGDDSDRSALSPTHSMPQEATPVHPPETERRLAVHHPLRLLLVAIVVVVLVVLAGGFGVFRAVSQPSRQASTAFQVTHCPFALDATLVEGKNVTCGFLVVPEDRSQPQSPTIRLAVAIFKAPSSQPDPDPVLFLSGGPGGALLETMGPRYNAGNLLSKRDLILFDQRGVGYSQPSLRCLDNETLQSCHSRLLKSGINLNAFTTLEDAADVHDLIRTLGYRQVNLYGVSYGTRLALTVMRQYPGDLRSVVLNSVLPPQVDAFTNIPQAAERAFEVLFQGCAADRSCNAAYPHLQTVFYQLVAELNTTPITFQATPPLTGVPVTVHFTGNDLVLWLRQSLYNTDLIPLLPRVLFQIRQHDYTQLASIYGNTIDTTSSIGLFYSVMCGEDMAFTTQHDLETSVRGLPAPVQPALLNFGLFRYAACQLWGVKPVPTPQKEPVRSTIPTLILQGEYDPVTPPANGMRASQTLSKSYFFLFPGVGHGVSSPISCPSDITKAFWENPTEKPNSSCISGMPEPFFT
jgi:pimeloyl-ACP methyl ester carboxylesterase